MSKKLYNFCIIDRFEGDWAVIEYNNKFFDFPKELLPKDAKESDVLRFNIEVDIEETEKRKKAVENLAEDLFTEE